MGLLVYDMATIAFVSGIVAFFGFSLVTAFVPLLVAYAWLNVNLQVLFCWSPFFSSSFLIEHNTWQLHSLSKLTFASTS